MLIILFNLAFIGVFFAFFASLVISCLAVIVYTTKKLPYPINFNFNLITGTNPVTKSLLLFSLPLLGVVMLRQIISWTDTLMIGFFKIPAQVGLYNAAIPLARFISAPLGAVLVIYMPVVTSLYAKGLIFDLRRNFEVITKWLCSLTLPIFFIFFLYPEPVLGFLFGKSYSLAANALMVLSLGFIVNNFLGPNGATLLAMGKSNFLMWATLVATLLNITLNASLIPVLGIFGAAIASVAAITSINLIRCWKVYSLSKVQPLSKNLLKPTLVFILVLLPFYFTLNVFFTVTFWMLPILIVLYYILYGLAVLLTKSIDQEDIKLLLAIEKRSGMNANSIKRVFKKFL